ncbi:host attachment protein [Fischerella sp. PCC 9605]|uniref:host attachment protein n=1 Tax=Fischerella sp. PCC 9605 TaxID=1173024 RepID=UPI00047C2CA4|nr:host attachment protein [Fischerella sp. PCC 9605]
MNQVLVAVIDGTRARFLTLEQAELPEYESSPNLVEHKSLFNPVKELQGKELWANVKSGRNQGLSGQAHAYDDGRQQHVTEFERRFAQVIGNEILNFTQAKRIQRLLLIAEPHILGIVREVVTPLLPKNLQIQDLAKDLSKFKLKEIYEYLASKSLLPIRKQASG